MHDQPPTGPGRAIKMIVACRRFCVTGALDISVEYLAHSGTAPRAQRGCMMHVLSNIRSRSITLFLIDFFYKQVQSTFLIHSHACSWVLCDCTLQTEDQAVFPQSAHGVVIWMKLGLEPGRSKNKCDYHSMDRYQVIITCVGTNAGKI